MVDGRCVGVGIDDFSRMLRLGGDDWGGGR